MKIPKGLATWAGLIAAVGQYLGAVAVWLSADDQLAAIAPLVTATATLWKVIEGRMNQATALAARPATPTQQVGQQAAAMGTTTSSGANYLADVIGGQIVGSGVAGRAFSPGTGTSYAYGSDPGDTEPGDPDALPEYGTTTNPPQDQGDTSANGDTGEREA